MQENRAKFKVGDKVVLVDASNFPDHGYWQKTRHLLQAGLRGTVVSVDTNDLRVKIPIITQAIGTNLGFRPVRWAHDSVATIEGQLADHFSYYQAITGE